MLYVFISLGAVLLLLILVILIRTLMFSNKIKDIKKEPLEIEQDDIVNKLGELIKIKTVSHEDKDLIDFNVFQQYIDKVKELYPLVFKACEFTQTNEYAIKLKLKGKSSDKPTV